MRATMISVLQEKFAAMDLTFSIGGQISFDVFPRVSARHTNLCDRYCYKPGTSSLAGLTEYIYIHCQPLCHARHPLRVPGMGQDLLPAVRL